MKLLSDLKDVFKIFQDKEVYFREIDKKQSNKIIYRQIIIICLFGFIYGLVMGSYLSLIQAFVAGIKVMILFITTLIICFPSFYIVQLVLGSKLTFRQMSKIVLSGFVLSSTITLSFVPVIIFFLITGNNYHFLQLLHVSIFMFAGIFGIRLIVDALKYACDNKGIYPQIGVTVFRVWIIILAFVGIQLAWNLRPFLGDKNDSFKLFRKYEGNFYTAIVYSFQQIMNPEQEKTSEYITNNPFAPIDTINDTISKN